MKTLDQRRAQHAWKTVSEAKNESNKDDVRGAIMSLPAQIVGSGLGPALAFLNAKGKTANLLQALGDWVLDKRWNPQSTKEPPAANELLRRFADGDGTFLRQATDETLAYLQWLKRFAEAEMPKAGA